MYVVEKDKTPAGAHAPRFSPLKMVARALGALQTAPEDEPQPQVQLSRPSLAAPLMPVIETRTYEDPAPGGDSFLAVVNAMLALDDAAPLETDETEFDLVSLIGEAHDAFAAAAQSRGVTLALTVAPGAPGRYVGDFSRLRQTLLNLLSGALKATADDTVVFEAAWEADELKLLVADAAVGALMSKVLADPAQPGPRRPAAHRLGLCRTSALAMGGALRALPDDGVEVSIPLRRVAEARAVAPRETRDEMASAPAPLPMFAPGLRVLVAEDNAAQRQMLATVLAGMGVEPVVVSTGQEAVAAWREESWGLLLVDIEGEAIAGRGVARSIRHAEAVARWPRMPMLALAAHVKRQDLEPDFEAVIDGLVAKPIHAASLHQALARALDAAPAATGLHAAVG